MSDYILGLDLGEASLGWAAVKSVNGQPKGLIDVGVRVFPMGADLEEGKAEVVSHNVKRRTARGMRRVKERRTRRKEKTLRLLQTAGLLPREEKDLRLVFHLEPYVLRAQAATGEISVAAALAQIKRPELADALKAMDGALGRYALGRAFYHLAQRRGFKSNRKSGGDKKEEGKLAQAIKGLAAEIVASGEPTLGAYLHAVGAKRERLETGQIRLRERHHPSRAMYEYEFDLIWHKQAPQLPEIMTDELRAKLREAIYYQRPFELTEERRSKLPRRANAHRAPQLAPCSLLGTEKRCEAGIWVAQEFRIWKEVNNLVVYQRDGTQTELTAAQRAKLAERLGRQGEMSFAKMRTLLELPKTSSFNLEEGGRKKLKGNTVEAALASAFGEESWLALADGSRLELRAALTSIEEHEKLAAILGPYQLAPEHIEALQRFSAPQGHLSYSAKAMEILLPYLRAGLMESKAIDAARADKKLPAIEADHVYETLPPPPKDVTNPLVKRALHELRKVVNAIIREHGKPVKINVELARSLKMNEDDRQNAINTNNRNKERNEIAKKWWIEHGVAEPKRDDLLAYRLWQDQGGLCPYSGRAIAAEELLRGGSVQIDHILPYSRTLDNRYDNLVLTFAGVNLQKGDHTPYEYKHGAESEAFLEMKTRVAAMEGFTPRKKSRFTRSELKDDEFKDDAEKWADRKLVDTQYASRLSAEYLNLLYDVKDRLGEKRVLATSGGVTSELRYLWGMNSVLGHDRGNKKNRDDHRHHAVDAIAIACTTRGFVKLLADSEKTNRRADDKKFPFPWESFRGDVEEMICHREQIWNIDGREIKTYGTLVSHRPTRGLVGQFHKETNYGPTANPSEFAYRKPVQALTGAMVEKIRDRACPVRG